ncbi:hypothetical protein H663_015410 [Limnohabitans planktonicus II-D5]|uniref:Uncharacterized protein n=1 Tax=Limnohabitans planktonicus II-D5 TaxID=1293045 RepID=A0A2T7UAV7_9BURK|nr:hypothetical protein H663_015410 [Limnohabitans planktonicus II-D5]
MKILLKVFSTIYLINGLIKNLKALNKSSFLSDFQHFFYNISTPIWLPIGLILWQEPKRNKRINKYNFTRSQ